MNYIKKIIVIIIIATLFLSACTDTADKGTSYEESVEMGSEYPVEMFPIFNGSTVYKYEFNKGVIDVTFGSNESYEKVSKYYDLLFEHSKYDVTAEKLTNLKYISSGKTNHYKYLLEVNKSVHRKEKKLYDTIVNLRITINDFATESINEWTPTPEPVQKITPAPTNTVAPTDTPSPTPSPNVTPDDEVISTVDMVDERVFIECLKIEEEIKDNNKKLITLKLKIVNYGQEETGYISIEDFALVDEQGVSYYSDMTDSIYAGGVNILAGGYCIDYIDFLVDDIAVPSVLAMPGGLGNRISSSYDLELIPLAPPIDAGAYDSVINDIADISHIPTFIIGQEHTIDGVLKVKLNDAQYFINHTSSSIDNLMYTFSMEFTNISSNVIIPAELREFVLYDIKHNIIIKPTLDLTPYEELLFKPVQNGLSENYHISFEVFEETNEIYLCLMLASNDNQDNPIIYKIR